MAQSSSYWELLRHPLWQAKRLAVMERAGFACEECGDDTNTLNVHHRYYEKGKKPWEYPDESLRCLCEQCHKQATELSREAAKLFGLLSSEQGFVIGVMKQLLVEFGEAEQATLESAEQIDGALTAAFRYASEDTRRTINHLFHIAGRTIERGQLVELVRDRSGGNK